MTDPVNTSPVPPVPPDLTKEIERINAENQFLRQQMDFQNQFTNERLERDKEFAAHKKEMGEEINRRLLGSGLVALIVFGLSMIPVYQGLQGLVVNRLDKEFSTERLQVTITSAAEKAAQKQTKELIEGRLNPAVEDALKQIGQQRQQVATAASDLKANVDGKMAAFKGQIETQGKQDQAGLTKLHDEYTKEIGTLKLLTEHQQKLQDIAILKAQAADGDYQALKSLDSYKSGIPDLDKSAVEARMDVGVLYLTGNRVYGTSIWLNNLDGTHGLTNEAIPTPSLIYIFLLNSKQDWKYRVKAAQILGTRREKIVFPALLQATKSDPNLWVKRSALVSFQTMTGFLGFDVFDFEGADKWWEQNGQAFLKTLPQ